MNAMRWLAVIVVGASLMSGAGCAKTRPGKGATSPAKGAAATGQAPGSAEKKVVVTPATGISGKVVDVNVAAQFVVLSFEGGALPVLDQKLNVYRAGLKVGQVKVSKEQIRQNLVADLVAGEARVGDEVRPD